MRAEWTDGGWKDRGSNLDSKDVEKILGLRLVINKKAQQKQHSSHQSTQAEL